MNSDRYSRQMQVPSYGVAAQRRLAQASVLVVGAGGLGSPVAATLVGAGVGSVTIMDFDTVGLSNLHRQWLYTEADVDRPKVEVLAAHLSVLNKEVDIHKVNSRLHTDNVNALIMAADLVIDAADNFPTSFLLSDACFAAKVALSTASVNQLYGYTGLFCAGVAPSLRAVFPKVPLQQASCDVVGVTAPAVSVVAGLQSQLVLDQLTGAKNWLGHMHYIDLRSFNLRSIDCSQSKEPRTSGIQLISAQGLTPNDWVIDVREPQESESQAQAHRVDQYSPLSELCLGPALSEKSRIVFCCKSGQRAMIAAQHALNDGFDNTAVIIPSDSQ